VTKSYRRTRILSVKAFLISLPLTVESIHSFKEEGGLAGEGEEVGCLLVSTGDLLSNGVGHMDGRHKRLPAVL